MTITDITIPLSRDLLVWPSDPPVQIEQRRFVEKDGANLSQLCMSLHSGTHLDPPAHFFTGGATADQFPLDVLIGPADVLDLPDLDAITAEDLERQTLPTDCRRLLLRTRNSRWWAAGDMTFHEDYVGLTAGAGQWVLDRGIRLLGIDYLSVDPYRVPGNPVHRALLARGVIILETIDLSAVSTGRYQLHCLPLLIARGDGAPARVVLES